jgi:hypothetical protein
MFAAAQCCPWHALGLGLPSTTEDAKVAACCA